MPAGSSAYPAAFDADAVILRPDVGGPGGGGWYDDTDAANDANTVSGVTHQIGSLVQWHRDMGAITKAIQREMGINPSASFADIATRLNGMTTVRKTADQNLAGTAAVNVTDLAFPIPAASGQSYTMDFTILWSTTTATSSMGVSHTYPAVGTNGFCSGLVQVAALAADGAAAHFFGSITGASGGDVVLSTAAVATGTIYVAHLRAVYYAGTTANTAGNYQVQCRSEATAASTTVKVGSHGIMWTG